MAQGELAREVVSRSKFSDAFSTARKATWGGLWPSDMAQLYGVERAEAGGSAAAAAAAAEQQGDEDDAWEAQQRALLERFGSALELGEDDDEFEERLNVVIDQIRELKEKLAVIGNGI